jgi:hypothetical protein
VEAGIPLGKSQKYSVSLRPDLTTSVRLSFEARFLTIIPASKPNVRLGVDSAINPILTAIMKHPDRLKACIVTGKQNIIGLYLFENYRPSSSAMATIVPLMCAACLIYKTARMCVCVHPCARMSNSSMDASIDVDRDIESCLVEGARHIPPVIDLRISANFRIEVVLPPNGVPASYFKGLVSEMLALVRPTAQEYMGCKSLKERGLSPRDLRLDFFGATISEAMSAGDVVSTCIFVRSRGTIADSPSRTS